MNQELRQRLIGAVVVTALAAIFIPMLFDDPVDDSGQVVSELVIPAEPALPVDDTAKKLPESPADVPGGTTSLPADTSADNLRSDEIEPDVLSTDELEAEAPNEEAQEQAIDRPADNKNTDGELTSEPSAPSLDTGIVEEEPNAIDTTAVKKPRQKPVQRPTSLKNDGVKPPPKPIKAAPVEKTEKIAKAISTENPVKPLKPTPSSRWYIQAGSFSKKENALSLSESLRKQGMPVVLETIQVAGKGTFYRLKVGPELDKKRAVAMKSKLDQQHIKTILVAE